MTQSILDSRNWPEDLKRLSRGEVDLLASEIRERLIQIGDECGGHLASNLGVVELTIALHAVFDSPKDKLLWDVGHQTYVHKMLTGRLDQMSTIRKKGGLSGFTKISESEHDIFGAGHASTSLSAALGIAHARNRQDKDHSVVSVIGDATLSGGMAFEALNNVEQLKSNFICVLNDNDMSISKPIGSMADYMTKLRTSQPYNKAKYRFERILGKIPKIGVPLTRKIERAVERVRDIVLDFKFGVIFEEFGFKYLGPLDGHNTPVLVAALKYAKTYNGPILIHIITKKGKGHAPAEQDPFTYHGVSPKKKSTSSSPKPVSYTEVFGKSILDIGKKRSDIMVVTPAMKIGSGLTEYAKTLPQQFIDVGIAEEHAVTYCAGLARAGIKPVLAIYSTFLQRGYDQIIHDVTLQKLDVVFAIDRAGLVGEDGPTHHGVFDYAFLLPIPNLVILAPKDGVELTAMLNWSVDQPLSVSIRYPKGALPSRDGQLMSKIEMGKSEILVDGSSTPNDQLDVTILGAGSMAWPGAEIAEELNKMGYRAAAVNLRYIKPLDRHTISAYAKRSKLIVVLEEGSGIGGVYSHILGSLNGLDARLNQFAQFAIPDRYIDHGKIPELKEDIGLDTPKITEQILAKLKVQDHQTVSDPVLT